MFQDHGDVSLYARKSFDDTNLRLEEKYGEKFWQNQAQRVIKQNKNISLMLKTSKSIIDKEKQDLKTDNEKLTKKIAELEEKLKKVNSELSSYKEEIMKIDTSNKGKQKIFKKPMPKLQPPQTYEEIKINDSSVTEAESSLRQSKESSSAKLTSDKASIPANASVSIQPKTNTVNNFKAPLKIFSKKSSQKEEKVNADQSLSRASSNKTCQLSQLLLGVPLA